MAGTLSAIQPFRYGRYVYDEETGLYYLRSRYCNLDVGRFINADTLIDDNIFRYCYSNPTNCYDPSGKDTIQEWDTDHPQYVASDDFGIYYNNGERLQQYYAIVGTQVILHKPDTYKMNGLVPGYLWVKDTSTGKWNKVFSG